MILAGQDHLPLNVPTGFHLAFDLQIVHVVVGVPANASATRIEAPASGRPRHFRRPRARPERLEPQFNSVRNGCSP